VSNIVERVLARLGPVRSDGELVLVAVDGPGRDGPAVAAALAADAVVAMDDFARPPDGALDPQEGYELSYDWGRLVEEVLDPIAIGQTARYRRGGHWLEVAPRGLVVVDGPFSTRPQLRGYYDLMVWINGRPPADPALAWYAVNIGPPPDALLVG
jgi:hypothetical protein